MERALSGLTVLPFDLATARVHARVWAELAARGINVGAHDLLIAPTAIAAGGAVATQDQRHPALAEDADDRALADHGPFRQHGTGR